MEKEKKENIWRREIIFGLRRRRGTKKEERNHAFGEAKLMVMSTDQPTSRPTNRENKEQSAIEKLEDRKTQIFAI